METQAKHTPTPWERSSESAYKILTPGGGLLAETSYHWVDPLSARLNAEFIVKACNSYDKMRELLSAAYQKLYIADSLIDPYTEEDGEDIAGQLFSEGSADEIDTFLQNTCKPLTS